MKVVFVFRAERSFAERRIDVGRHRRAGPRSRRAAPELSLGERQRGAAAGRADPLIVRRIAADFVAIAESALDSNQVFDVDPRAERMAAAAAARRLRARAGVFVKAHAELRRALKDMKELA